MLFIPLFWNVYGRPPSATSATRIDIPPFLQHIDGPPSPRARARNYVGSTVAEGMDIEMYQRAASADEAGAEWFPRYFHVVRGWGLHNTVVLDRWAETQGSKIPSLAIIGTYIDLNAVPFCKDMSSLLIQFDGQPRVVGELTRVNAPTLRWLNIHYDLRHGNGTDIHDTLERLLLTFIQHRISPTNIFSINLVLRNGTDNLCYTYDPETPYAEYNAQEGWTWDAVFAMLADAFHPQSLKQPEGLEQLHDRIAALTHPDAPFLRVLSDGEDEDESPLEEAASEDDEDEEEDVPLNGVENGGDGQEDDEAPRRPPAGFEDGTLA